MSCRCSTLAKGHSLYPNEKTKCIASNACAGAALWEDSVVVSASKRCFEIWAFACVKCHMMAEQPAAYDDEDQ